MPQLPTWISLIVGALVAVWGGYRIFVGFRSARQEETARARGGLYGMRRSTHFLMGTVYVLLGAMLTLHAFGMTLRDLPLPGLN